MARRSLRPHLNQIRSWVRQGRTDAWIAHQLEVSVKDIGAFKREHELAPAEADDPDAVAARTGEEVDLRAEDEALVAAALEAEPEVQEEAAEEAVEGDAEKKPARRRGRRGGRTRKRTADGPLEGTFDHGDEGYGLWLDPAISDDPVYAEHWAGHRQVEVVVEDDRIVIRRTGEANGTDDDDGES